MTRKIMINSKGSLQFANPEARVGVTDSGNIIYMCINIPENVSDSQILLTLSKTGIHFNSENYSNSVDWNKCGEGKVYIL